MKTFSTIIVATSIMVAMVHGQIVSQPMQDFLGHTEKPGEIIPGTNLTISFIINAAGGIWQQGRVIDSIAYVCKDVLPYLGSVIPVVDQTSLYWGFLCDEAVKASNDLDAFDATGLCDTLTSMLTDLTSENETLEINPDPSQGGDPFNILQILTNITKDLYGIDINMIINDPSTINTICTNVKENFLRPSLPDIISQFGVEMMGALFPELLVPICQDWESFLQLLGIEDSASPYYPIIQQAALTASEAVGYGSRENLCLAIIEQDTSLQEERIFSIDAITNILTIPEDAIRCTKLANDTINGIINPILQLEAPDAFQLTDGTIYQTTGFHGVTDLCTNVEVAFTNVVELPAPHPVQLIPGTSLTVEFFIDAAGGIWRQDRLIDSLAFVCNDALPDLESMVPDIVAFSQYYQPICHQVDAAARDLSSFDVTGSCNNITATITALVSGVTADRRRRQVDPFMEDPLGIIELLANTTKDLYGIDVNDPSTICPNIAQFLRSSLPDLLSQFGAEMMGALLDQAAPFCQDWDGLLLTFGIDSSSPLYQILQSAYEFGAQAVGYDNRQDMCSALDQALAVQDDGTARRTFARNIIENSFDVFTSSSVCSMQINGVINDIIEPIFRLVNVEGLPLTISDYVIYHYTGFMGVEGICNATAKAFTKDPGSTVMVTVSVESINGQALVYTPDLADRGSVRFQELRRLFCGGTKNHITSELGPDLQRVNCEVLEFRPGSVVADMQVEVQAPTQEVADSLAQNVVDLAGSDNLTLSANGETLSASALAVAEPVGSIVNITVTGESLDGVQLDFTSELANKESALFMQRQMLFCDGMKNFVMSNVGSSLLSMNCGVSLFRAGSLIADLWIELFAVSQTNADSLAQDVTDLASATNNTTLTAGAESLSVSYLSLTVTTTEPFGSIVNVIVTGESLNGLELAFTSDLANQSSTLFMERQTLFCEGMKNFVMSNVGSSLLSVNCVVSAFRAGSLIGDLLVEVFAASQADADSLAQVLTNIVSATDTTTLTAGADSLFVSSMSLPGTTTAPDAEEPDEGGLSVGALVGIIVGVICFLIIFVVLFTCFLMAQNMRRLQAEQMMRANIERGKQNGGFSHDNGTYNTPRYVYGVNAGYDRSHLDRKMYGSRQEWEKNSVARNPTFHK
ncbi:uncharacterized protein LOC115924999 [Strongylocentrotus purpuratus]|uniref:SEA domain-containing protein n=1 Tax=Strongylocentrotus purpuratus TaxID=7668 RepID=A0A7M7T039_STRPU|nr:uncharacterized protein LOC115924999 [Strongylocentrotus purpuratus]